MASTWPADNYPITVEHAAGAILTDDPSTWPWVTIPRSDIRDTVTIVRGRPDARALVEPTRVTFTIKNPTGKYSPRNPESSLYPEWGRGTPIRVSRAGSVRALAFIADLRMRWPSGNDTVCEIDVQASGILRYLAQGAKPSYSPVARAILATDPIDYWPAEDGSGATSIASALDRVSMRYAGTIQLGAAGLAGSATSVQLGTDTQMHAWAISHPYSGGGWSVAMVCNIATAPVAAQTLFAWSTTEALQVWQLILTPGSPDTITVRANQPDGTVVVNTSVSFTAGTVSEPYGRDLLIVLTSDQVLFEISWSLYVRTTGDEQTVTTATAAVPTVGVVDSLAMYPGASLDQTRVGHLTAWNRALTADEVASIGDQLDQLDGELASDRAARLGVEAGIGVEVTWDGVDPSTEREMGPQPTDTVLANLRQAEAVDGGVLFERLSPGPDGELLQLRSMSSLVNQSASLALNFLAGDLGVPFEPIEDDQALVNDFTATRPGGSSGRYVLTTGPNSTERGEVYDAAGSFNVHDDDALPHLAGWMVHLGTVDDQRYPLLALNLFGRPSLVADWITVDIGDRLTVAGGLAQLPADGSLDLMIQGWTETLDDRLWSVQVTCTPAKPWNVWELEDPVLGLLAPDSCVTAEDMTSTETDMNVTTTPLWTTTPAAPFDIAVGGERMTVTAISGASNPQTLTVTRSVNGVVKTHSSGAPVSLWSAHVLAR